MSIVLETEHYRFRRFEATDVDDVRALQERRLYEFLPLGESIVMPKTDDEVRRKIACWNEIQTRHPGLGYWRGSDRATDTLIGKIFLVPLGHASVVQLGGVVVSSQWGRRYAFEGCAYLIEYAFNTLKLPYLTTLMLTTNRPASAIAEAVGFRQVFNREFSGVGLTGYYQSADDWRKRRALNAAGQQSDSLRAWLRSTKNASAVTPRASVPDEVWAAFGVQPATTEPTALLSA